MRRSLRYRWIAAVILFLSAWAAQAQTDGTYSGYSPYSVFGPGMLHPGGTAWNRGMGGVGVAARSHRFINTLNPASVTARDSLSFMANMGLAGRTAYFSEDSKKALNTTVNLNDVVISFPMWRHTAMMVGLVPVTDVGYKITSTELDVYTGNHTFTSVGNGGMYQVFAAAAVTFWDRLSLGAQFNYDFGNINKKASDVYEDDSYLNAASGDSLQVYNMSAKFGLQYEQPVGKSSFITLGATYQLSTKITGYSIHYRELGSYARDRVATLLGESNLSMGDELSVGLSYRKADSFLVEVDYSRTDWSRSGMDQVRGFSNVGQSVFAPSIGQAFRAGVEFTPNRNDIRYYMRRCTYRVGAYFDQSYFTVDGAHVNAVGLTLGMTLPVFRGYNGITVGLDFGRRGLSASQLKENYMGFSLGFNVYDIWFQKRPYE